MQKWSGMQACSACTSPTTPSYHRHSQQDSKLEWKKARLTADKQQVNTGQPKGATDLAQIHYLISVYSISSVVKICPNVGRCDGIASQQDCMSAANPVIVLAGNVGRSTNSTVAM